MSTDATIEPTNEPTPGEDGAAGEDTMTVTVRDRASESPWGVGFTRPITRTVTISAICPTCGAHRGQPRGLNSCDDGAFYWVQVWDNPCGHVDHYVAVLAEARQRAGHTTETTETTTTGGAQR